MCPLLVIKHNATSQNVPTSCHDRHMCPLRRCTVQPWRNCGRLSGRRDDLGRPSSSWATRMHLAVKSPGSGEAASPPPQLPFGHAGEARATPELELRTCNSPGFRAGPVESARGWCLRGGSIPLPGFLMRSVRRLARRCRCFFSSRFFSLVRAQAALTAPLGATVGPRRPPAPF